MLEENRKSLAREMITNKSLSLENEQLLRENRQLADINSTLIESNKKYEQRWNSMYHYYMFYKQFYEDFHLKRGAR